MKSKRSRSSSSSSSNKSKTITKKRRLRLRNTPSRTSRRSRLRRHSPIRSSYFTLNNSSTSSSSSSLRKDNIKGPLNIALENPELRYSRVLNLVCGPNTRGECVDFGYYKNSINQYFDYFNINKNSRYIEYTKKIGAKSSNGAVFEIKFNKNSYIAFAVLKVNLNSYSDSVLYEHFVGKTFINKYLNIFPCFVETYNLYEITPNSKEFIKHAKKSTLNLNNWLTIIPDKDEFKINEIAKKSCEYGKTNNLGMLIQHYDNFRSIDDVTNGDDFYDVYNLLYQIYFTLYCMKDVFTHYDLHGSNVMAYKPYVGNKYVEMNYHLNDGTIIKFPTERLMKIIDYGRCHFNHVVNGNVENTEMIVDTLCSDLSSPDYTKDSCYGISAYGYEKFCGETYGMRSVFGENEFIPQINTYGRNFGSFSYIHPSKNNVSHDLRLFNIINSKYDLLQTVPGTTILYEKYYGTPEYPNVTYDGVNNKEIRNLSDAFIFFNKILTDSPSRDSWTKTFFVEWSTNSPSSDNRYNKYGASGGWYKMGEFHIYEDQRPYEFISSV